MRSQPRTLITALALALSLGVVATSLAQSEDKGARPLKMGVVDIGVLFKAYKRKDDLEKEINAKREAMKKEIEDEQEKVRDARIRLEKSSLREGSEPWLREREKIRLAQFQLELKTERLQAALKAAVEQHTLLILGELEKTIAFYGGRHGFDLILKIDDAERQSAGAPAAGELAAHFQERIFRAQISDVLYYKKDQLDITTNVLQVLNSDANIKRMEQLGKK